MTCKETIARASDYYEGVFSSSEVQEIKAHLATCESCRSYFEHRLQMVTALGRLPEASTLSPEAKERLLVAFRQQQSPTWPFTLKHLWAIAAVAAVVIVVFSFGWRRWRSSHPPVITAHHHVVADLRNRMILR